MAKFNHKSPEKNREKFKSRNLCGKTVEKYDEKILILKNKN